MVSQDFVLLRHSSPSFGSQHVCSDSNLSPKIMIGRWCPLRFPPSHFHCAPGFATQTLAHMLDSLVRVTRRAGGDHFVLVEVTAKHPLRITAGARGYHVQARYLPLGRLPQREATRTRTHAQYTRLKPSERCEGTTLVATASLSAISGTL